MKNNELYYQNGIGGTTGNIPIPLPDGVIIDSQMNLSWSLENETYVKNSREALVVGEVGVTVIAAIACLVLFANDVSGIGVGDDAIAAGLGTYAVANVSKYLDYISKVLKGIFTTAQGCGAN